MFRPWLLGAVHRTETALPYDVTLGAIVTMAVILLWMGRVPWCECGYIRLWPAPGAVGQNSQQLMDWYTPSHLIHGALFYAGLWFLVPNIPVSWRMVMATLIECGWEVLENTDAVIDRYRTATIALDYYGDSVVNSVSDALAMLAGFWLARTLPVWASATIVLGIELLTAVLIRDGLALNLIMLIWPSDAILEWQGGA